MKIPPFREKIELITENVRQECTDKHVCFDRHTVYKSEHQYTRQIN